MQNYKKFLLLALLPIFYAQALQAAPFCVQVQGIPPECIYDDAVQCRKRAAELGGLCAPNAAEITIPAGTGRYCIVDSNRIVQCNYVDRTSCNNDAVRGGGACMEAPNQGVQPDPYRQDPNINN